MKKVIASLMMAMFLTVAGAAAADAASYDTQTKSSTQQNQDAPKKAGPRESENN